MPINPTKRQALIDHCITFAEAHDGELPAVTIERFFDGNDDLGSLMCNIDVPSTDKIRDALIAIRARPEVESVLIRVYETMDEDYECWPFAEQVLITTAAGPDKIRGWFPTSMTPDDVSPLDETFDGLPRPKPGSKTWVAWWD